MKKKKTIVIKDSKLKKIRNNLRVSVIQGANSQLKLYFDERHRLSTDLNGNIREISESKKARTVKLTRKMSEINRNIDASIIRCPACRKIDRDMKFNLELKQWFCSKCYKDMCELYYEWQRKEGKVVFDNFDEEYYKTFLGLISKSS